MEDQYFLDLSIVEVEDGQFLATSQDLPGLVAQGRTVSEAFEIAQDLARKLLESYVEHGDPLPDSLKPLSDKIELPVAVGISG